MEFLCQPQQHGATCLLPNRNTTFLKPGGSFQWTLTYLAGLHLVKVLFLSCLWDIKDTASEHDGRQRCVLFSAQGVTVKTEWPPTFAGGRQEPNSQQRGRSLHLLAPQVGCELPGDRSDAGGLGVKGGPQISGFSPKGSPQEDAPMPRGLEFGQHKGPFREEFSPGVPIAL